MKTIRNILIITVFVSFFNAFHTSAGIIGYDLNSERVHSFTSSIEAKILKNSSQNTSEDASMLSAFPVFLSATLGIWGLYRLLRRKESNEAYAE